MEDGSQTSYSSFSSPNRKSGRSKKIFILSALILVLGLIAFGISRSIGNKGISSNKTLTTTPTMSPTTTPTPTDIIDTTPTPTLKTKTTPTPTKISGSSVKNLSIQILNGSGVVGAGKKAADFLSGLGYTITSTGNADNFEYSQTTIQIKSAKSSLLNQLKKDLTENYTIGSTSTTLSSSSSADAIVIIGKE